MTLRGFTLILGGARSGKSRFGLERANATEVGRRVFVATAEGLDEEMRERIARHRAERSPSWVTVEEPLDLATVLERHRTDLILIDCLTLWLSNILHREASSLASRTAALQAAIAAHQAPVIAVANEVGLGLVPTTPLGRQFRDDAGRMNQQLAAAADEAHFVVAGLPMRLK